MSEPTDKIQAAIAIVNAAYRQVAGEMTSDEASTAITGIVQDSVGAELIGTLALVAVGFMMMASTGLAKTPDELLGIVGRAVAELGGDR